MGIGIHGRHGDQDVDRVVILMIENQRRFQRDQRKASFLDPSSGRPCGIAGRELSQNKAVLSYAIQNGFGSSAALPHRLSPTNQRSLDGFLPVLASACKGWSYSPPANHVISFGVLTTSCGKCAFDHFQQFWAKIRWREHVAYANHVFIAGDANLTGDMGGGDDNVRAV